MRIVFMGTGDIGLPTLRWLLESDHELAGVVTQPDRPVGRKQVLTPPQVKVLAEGQGVPVEQPERIRKEMGFLRAWEPEVIVVMAYGQILPKELLDLPSIACLNLHASLLPRHRGASPIQAAVREGDAESGITVMYVAEGLDTGDLLLAHKLELADDETGGSLHDRLADLAPAALAEGLGLLAEGEAPRTPQDEALATYAPKLTREDGEVDWSLPADEIERLLRAYQPWPGSRTALPDGRRLKLFPPARVAEGKGAPGEVLSADGEGLLVATGEGALQLSELQAEGSRRMTVEEFLRGHDLGSGDRLGGQPS